MPSPSTGRKKCTSISYNCGSICLSLHKNCRIGSAAIGKARLKKIAELSKLLAIGGKDSRKGLGKPDQGQLEALMTDIAGQRSANAANLRLMRHSYESTNSHLETIAAGKKIAAPLVKSLEKHRTALQEVDSLKAQRRVLKREMDELSIYDDDGFKRLYNEIKQVESQIESNQQRLDKAGGKFIDSLKQSGLLKVVADSMAAEVRKSTGWEKDYPDLDNDISSFLQISGGKGYSTIKGVKVRPGRAGTDSKTGIIVTEPNDSAALFHEMAHHIEFESPKALQASRDFLESRRTGKNQKMSDLTGNPAYTDDEIAVPDKFVNPYAGRVYDDHTATEVISMGLEALSKGRHLAELALKDPEHLYFVLGVIRGNRV